MTYGYARVSTADQNLDRQKDALKNYGVDRLVYISCKPTSLARDLVTLLAGGYQVDKVCAVDMFPNTAGIETVCLLSKVAGAAAEA